MWLLAPTPSGTGNITPAGDPGISNLNAVDAKVVNAVSYWVDIPKEYGWTHRMDRDLRRRPAKSVHWASSWPSGRLINGNGNGFTMPTAADFGGGSPAITAAAGGTSAINEANNVVQYANNYTYSGGPQVYAIVDAGDQIQGLEFGGGQSGDASPDTRAGRASRSGRFGDFARFPVGARKWRLRRGKVAQ